MDLIPPVRPYQPGDSSAEHTRTFRAVRSGIRSCVFVVTMELL